MTSSRTSRWMGAVVVVFYAFALDLISLITATFTRQFTPFWWCWVIFSTLFFVIWDFNQQKSKGLLFRIGFVTLCTTLALVVYAGMSFLLSKDSFDLENFVGGMFIAFISLVGFSFLLGLLVVVLGWVIRKWFIKSPSEGSPLKP